MSGTFVARIASILSFVVLWTIAPPALGQCELRWRLLAVNEQPSSLGWSAEYDAASGAVMVLANPRSGDPDQRRSLFELRGNRWRRLPTSGVAPGVGSTLVFDPIRGRLVCIDRAEGQPLRVLEWDGRAWEIVEPPAGKPRPGDRSSFGAAFDPATQTTLIFGGQSPTNNETWGWNGSTWTQFAAKADPMKLPSRRSFAMLIPDPPRGRLLLHGGTVRSPTTVLRDTWEWDGATWTLVSQDGPQNQDNIEAGTFDPSVGRPVLFAQDLQPGHNFRLWAWNGTAWTDTGAPPLSQRHGVVIYDGSTSRLQVLGSVEENLALEQGSWTIIDQQPSGRTCRMAYDPVRDRSVLPGGTTGLVWEWTGSAWSVWPGSHPPARDVRTWRDVFYYPPAQRVAISGGLSNVPQYNFRLTAWDGPGWTLISEEPTVSNRYLHASAFDAHRGALVMFGGRFDNVDLAETWEYDGGAWAQVAIAGPSRRRGHVMVYDSIRENIVLFGGRSGSQPINAETWTYDGDTPAWTQQPASGPPAVRDAGMVFDERRGVALLFGGQTGTGMSDALWEWNGSDWSPVQITGARPAPRSFFGFSYDSRRAATLLFGGAGSEEAVSSGPYFADTWALHRAADHNIDGEIDGRDVSEFVHDVRDAWGSDDPVADFDGSGRVTAADIAAFVRAWVSARHSGC